MEETHEASAREFTVQNRMGIHTRPAAQIVRLANRYPDVEITVSKEGQTVVTKGKNPPHQWEKYYADVAAHLTTGKPLVITAEWVARVMERNGLAAQTLVMSPQGVPATSTTTRARPLVSGGPLRIAWLGRLNPAKGLHVLVQALALIPELQIRLDAYALREGDNGEYFRQLRQGIAQDPRIRLLPAVAPDEVNGTLANYDVVAVPSQGYETGPLVVLEAFASGIPVIGSALGGIAALVTDRETGLLVDPLRPDAWARAISDVYHDRTRLHRMMKNIVAPRTMADVARDKIGRAHV